MWQLAQVGAGFWLRDARAVRGQAEALARAQFAARRDPRECALLYVALGRRALLQVAPALAAAHPDGTLLRQTDTPDEHAMATLMLYIVTCW